MMTAKRQYSLYFFLGQGSDYTRQLVFNDKGECSKYTDEVKRIKLKSKTTKITKINLIIDSP
jgi:hypothetical protein